MEIVKIKRAGLNLVGTLEKPELKEGEKCPLVIIMHGITEERQKPIPLSMAEELLKHSIASVRFDFNGHGESEGSFEDMTVMNELEDAREILRYAKSLDFAESISIFGHSQGGVVAGMIAGCYQNDISCIVQMSPAATLKDDAIIGTIMGMQYDPNNIPEYISFWDKRLSSLYFSTAQYLPIYEMSARYKGPVCLIHGTGDNIVSCNASKKYHEVYADSELHLIEGQDHWCTDVLSEVIALAADFILTKVK
ncbi:MULTISPECIES: alpha/beta hydrolase family protein [Clostridium]|uniref:alpha/beta hydrolase family protein n=1 Tax=Clostridium TaxID=1485 RepID=UPI0008255567|nr:MULTISPECIES: alpha/beta fold hydrolase [Clostridium]PJI09185.1 alpha/beta hydrolase [Clostridium sp. CT7]